MSFVMILALQATLAGLPQDMVEGCDDKEGTIALSSCYSDRTTMWQKRLDAAYPAALRFAKGSQRDALRHAQDAWLSYRRATCKFYNLGPGTIRTIEGAYCMLDLTRHRALELEEYVLP